MCTPGQGHPLPGLQLGCQFRGLPPFGHHRGESITPHLRTRHVQETGQYGYCQIDCPGMFPCNFTAIIEGPARSLPRVGLQPCATLHRPSTARGYVAKRARGHKRPIAAPWFRSVALQAALVGSSPFSVGRVHLPMAPLGQPTRVLAAAAPWSLPHPQVNAACSTHEIAAVFLTRRTDIPSDAVIAR